MPPEGSKYSNQAKMYNTSSVSGSIMEETTANSVTLYYSQDAFTKREKASEDYAIRMREKDKLLELKKKLAEQHEHLKKLEEHM